MHVQIFQIGALPFLDNPTVAHNRKKCTRTVAEADREQKTQNVNM